MKYRVVSLIDELLVVFKPLWLSDSLIYIGNTIKKVAFLNKPYKSGLDLIPVVLYKCS